MNDTKTGTTTHLAAEARERIGMGGEPGPGESRHLASCERCRREIAEIGSLQSGSPPRGARSIRSGSNQVMARVQLPAPRWSRALAGLRAHPPRVAAIAATAVAAVIGTFVWLTTRIRQVTPGVVAKLVYERGHRPRLAGRRGGRKGRLRLRTRDAHRGVPCGSERLERRWRSGDVDAGRDDLDVDVAEAHGSLAQCDKNRSETNWMIDTMAHAEACAIRLDSGPGDGG